MRYEKGDQVCVIEIEWGRRGWAAGSDKQVSLWIGLKRFDWTRWMPKRRVWVRRLDGTRLGQPIAAAAPAQDHPVASLAAHWPGPALLGLGLRGGLAVGLTCRF